MQNKLQKERSQSCYERKVKKLSDFWNNCPKLQAKITIDKWLSQIKKPMKRG
ncbi:MAG: hypothetical protein KKA19_09595 [Candidatus Margulisbacteria bacterium]|nr:hypothetical protein [Candidatus Margulisiibacteriota bacterium]